MFMSTLPLLPSPPKPTRNPNRFNSVELQSCLSLLELCKSTTELTQVHSKLIKLGLFHHSLALTRVLASSSLFPNGDMNYTQSIFDRDENPNTFAYNVMIRGYLQHNQSKKAIYMFYKMVCDVNYAPNYITFPFVLKACSKMEAIEEGKQVHGQVIKFGFGDDLYVQNSLISLYSTCGRIDFARMVFEEMKNPDVVSWNSIIKGLVDMGVVQEAREIFDKMPKRSVVTWNCLISGYVKVRFMEEARKLFDEMDVKDSFSWNTMIGGYVDSGITEAARKLFDRMPEGTKDLITFKMMIDGYAKELRFKEVLEIFQEMQKLKVKPDSFILVNALSACSNMVTLEQGEQIQVYIDRHGVEMDAVLGTALVDMFAKCGKIEKAFSVFDGLVERDNVTWNSVIYNLGIHGYSREALAIFSDMLKSNIPPDETTFLGLLTTCCHCGLADDGKRYFHFMSNVYNLAPKVEHYGCMVDLLGRANRLNEAMELIETSDAKSNRPLWGALLGASCRLGNIDLAEYAAKQIMDLDPSDTSCYVELANMYSEAGKHEKAIVIRKSMRENGIEKEPGCSSIEINGVIHEFRVSSNLPNDITFNL